MSKLFCLSPGLRVLERQMQQPPGYRPRGYGICIIEEMNWKSRGNYSEIVDCVISRMQLEHLKKRVEEIFGEADKEIIFHNMKHRNDFYSLLMGKRAKTLKHTPNYAAAVFLLSADEELWEKVCKNILDTGIYFDRVRLGGVTLEQYILFHAAKDVYNGTKHIRLSELTDRDLIPDEILRLIVNAFVIEKLIGGDYKLLLEPIAYVTFEGVRTAFTATEAAMYNQVRGGMLRKKLTSLTHKNLPLAMFLETSDLGYPAWGGGKNQKVSDDEIIGSLGLGIVRFNEVVTPEVIAADYEYRVDTDVVTTVTISGGQSDPDHPVSVTFSILGRNYTVNNVYYPEDGQQLVWVKWHTPSTEQYITINVSVSGGGSASKGTITANIVDLDKNPPPNPVADDRNDSYNAGNAIIPANPQKTSASWSVWRPWWKEKWVCVGLTDARHLQG